MYCLLIRIIENQRGEFNEMYTGSSRSYAMLMIVIVIVVVIVIADS